MFKKLWFTYLAAYFFWAVSLALALWLLLVARNTLPVLLANAVQPNPVHAAQLHKIFDNIFVLVGGIGWLVCMTILEHHYRKGAQAGKLWTRVGRVLGILLVLLFFVDAIQVIKNGLLFLGWMNGLLLLVEIAGGAALLYLSRPRPVLA